MTNKIIKVNAWDLWDQRRLYLTIITAVTLIASCSTPTPSNIPFPGSQTPIYNTDSSQETESIAITSLRQRAANSPSPLAETYSLELSRILASQGKISEAREVLQGLNTARLERPLATEILLQQARLSIDLSQPELALTTLHSRHFSDTSLLEENQHIAYRLILAQANFASKRFLESVQERMIADTLLPSTSLTQNHELLWAALSLVPTQELQEQLTTAIDAEARGWYELGLIGNNPQYSLDRQLVELENWRQRWQSHTAALYMPKILALAGSAATEQPEQIALLLPLGILPGSVIRDGFMSAYFKLQNSGGDVPAVHFYDTTGIQDIYSLYQQVISEGAELVIGPLLKQNVERLQQQANLSVPILALNSIEGVQPASSLFYQFSLSPEHEAQQIASQAWLDGHKNVAILSPSNQVGNDSDLRKRNSFIQEWEKLGGKIVSHEFYRNDYTDIIEVLLSLNDSENRKEQLSNLLNQPLEFTQRRRQDIDFIFLIAQPGPARQINPRLSYLYAGDLPVYASQDIYSGISRPLEDADLNGIIFSDSPWLLSQNDELKAETTVLFPQNTAPSLRLQAFGIDAFRLYPRLKQLEAFPESQLNGATGVLKFGENRNIIRELIWAKIDRGQIKLLDTGDQ